MSELKIYILLLSLLFVPSFLMGQTNADASSIPDIDSFFSGKNFRKQSGIISVYFNAKQVYLEVNIDLLERDMLIAAQVSNGHGLRSRLLKGINCVRFTKGNKNELNLHQLAFPERVNAGDTMNLRSILSKSNLVPIYKKYNIEACSSEKNSYLIDITEDLLTGSDWFEVPIGDKIRGLRPSESQIVQTLTITDGAVFEITRMYGTSPADSQGSDPVLSTEGYAPLTLQCLVQTLSDEKMSKRHADPRIGYLSLSYTDYGKYPYGVAQDSVVERWNLSRRKGKLDVVIDSRFPSSLVSAIKNGTREWEKSFEKAGWHNLFNTIESKSSENVWLTPIRIAFDGNSDKVSSTKIVHPETGEILYANINFGRQALDGLIDDYFLSCGQVLAGDAEKKNIEKLLFKSLLVKEFGRVLGLKDNYVSSHAYSVAQISNANWLKKHSYTASVMDETPFNYALPPQTKAGASARIPFTVGSYDEFAIQWAYDKNTFHEKDRLLMLSKAIDNKKYAYSTNEGDVSVAKHDLASDKLIALEQGMHNLKAAFEGMQTHVYENGKVDDRGTKLLQMQRKGIDKYAQYIITASEYIGATDNGKFISQEVGKSAMTFMNKHFFNHQPDYFLTPYLKRNPLLNEANDNLLQHAPMLFAQLLSEKTINNLTKALLDANAYNIEDLREDIFRYLFPDFQKNKKPSSFQIELQFIFLETLGKQLKSGTKNNTSFQLFKWKEHIKDNLIKLSDQSEDEAEKMYYNYLLKTIE